MGIKVKTVKTLIDRARRKITDVNMMQENPEEESDDIITASFRISKKRNPQLYKWILGIEDGMRSHVIRKELERNSL